MKKYYTFTLCIGMFDNDPQAGFVVETTKFNNSKAVEILEEKDIWLVEEHENPIETLLREYAMLTIERASYFNKITLEELSASLDLDEVDGLELKYFNGFRFLKSDLEMRKSELL